MAKNGKIWSVSKQNKGLQKILSGKLGISQIVAQILINRGINTLEEAKAFLSKELADLHNPFLFADMKAAVDLIYEKIAKQEKILVFGDYDVDGITSTTILVTCLAQLGAQVNYYIPDRQTEGYGLNIGALQKAVEDNYKLIITVDCGITAIEETFYLKEQGIDIVITDHHEASQQLPWARAIINPKLEGSEYPFEGLAGVGVTFKLVQALLSKNQPGVSFASLGREYLDLVALGTVADIVPLKGENRIIVEHGLRLINNPTRPALKALVEVSGLKGKQINAGHVGFMLAPRLNAVGRLGKGAVGVEFLLTASVPRAQELAGQLDEENQNRQTVESRITEEAIKMIENNYDLGKNKVIVLASKHWHSGVIGIVASRIVEKFYRPTILISLEGEIGKGSCRSIKGFNIFEALQACSQQLLKFGGHTQAAGLSIEAINLEGFTEQINQYADRSLMEEDLIPKVNLDCEITFEEINEALVAELLRLEPFGFKNPGPLLVFRKARVLNYSEVGREGGHLRCKLGTDKWSLDGIGFKLASKMEILNFRDGFDFAFSVEKNEFRGKTSLQLNIKDFKPSIHSDNPFTIKDHYNLSFVDQLFDKAEECLVDDYYRNIGEKDEFYTKVVGVSFEGRQTIIAGLRPGQELVLRREHQNPYDEWAIKLETKDQVQVGYLNAMLAKNLAPVIDKGIKYNVFISAVTGGQGKNYGLNITLHKVLDISYEEKKYQLANLRQQYKGEAPELLQEKIREFLIGSQPYRPKQGEARDALLAGENTLAIFGTGRGKSAVFQSVAAFKALHEGLMSIIIYPLRALVNDQFAGMEQKFGRLGLRVFKANGSISELERLQLFKALEDQDVDIILTTPEFIEYHLERFRILKEKIGFFVVDESHHIADANRPAFKRLNFLIANLGNPLTLAVTATADDSVAEEIVNTLNLSKIIIDPHVRENLNIVDKRDLTDKNGYLKRIVKSGEKTIIYVNSRSKTVELASFLRSEIPELREKIVFYNAGLNNEERAEIENLFREGKVTTVVSTSAFGEGIDIPDVSNVVIYHLNFNNTEFNQQSGRAGRNGSVAKIHLLCGKRDVRINEFILDSIAPNRDLLAKLYLLLIKLSKKELVLNLSNSQLAEMLSKEMGKEVQDNTVSASIGILADLGLLEREFEGKERSITLLPQPKQKLDLETSLKYQEGLLEKNEFQKFQQFFFEATGSQLLNMINRPIYPQKYSKEEQK